MLNLRLLLLLIGGVFTSAGLEAQNSPADFQYVKYSDGWLTSSNASGLRFLPVENISFAEAYTQKNNGGFVNFNQSDNSFTAGARTESFYRVDRRTVFYGSVDFSNFHGKNMGASGFIDPQYNAFDIDELSYDTKGSKVLEEYRLCGAVSSDVLHRFTIGGKIDYRAANYAKHRDMHHTNKLLDLSLSTGVAYRLGGRATIGANYLYRRSVEGISYAIFGNTDKQYTSLINFGSFYGRQELFGESGYTYGDSPTFNRLNGVSMQFAVNFKRWKLFNEFTYESRKGYFGQKSPGTPVYTEHNAGTIGYKGVLSLYADNNLHQLELTANYLTLENYENIFKRENQPGGNYNIIYYGKNIVHERQTVNARIEYTANLDTRDYSPVWVLKAGADYGNITRKTSIYPFFRKQKINSYSFYTGARKNIFKAKNRYSLLLNILYGSGAGNAKNDGIYAAASENQKEPASIDDYLYREYEFLTAARIKGGAGAEYSRLIAGHVRGYVGLNCETTKAFNITYLNNNRFTSLTMTLGCEF